MSPATPSGLDLLTEPVWELKRSIQKAQEQFERNSDYYT